jgi:hypothetical protein
MAPTTLLLLAPAQPTRKVWKVPTTTTAKNAAPPADAAFHIVRAIASDGDATLAAETAIVVAAGS